VLLLLLLLASRLMHLILNLNNVYRYIATIGAGACA
jgi:hypothetical protein